MITKNFIKIVAGISIITNIILLCFLIQISSERIEQNDNISQIKNIDLSMEDYYEQQIYFANETLFYGKWKIVEYVWAELPQPSYISGFYQNEDGSITFRGPDTSTIIGMEITFDLDYVECSGEKYEYVCRPRTYSYPLSEDTTIHFNYAKTLGITGNYYSVVKFLLPGHDKPNEVGRSYKLGIGDIREVYLKDNNTMYADVYYGMTYRLERVVDKT